MRAIGTKLDIKPQAGRVEAEKLPEHALAAERFADAVKVYERRIRIGRRADFLEQIGGDRRQKVTATARGKEADFLFRQGHEVLIGLLHVAEAVLAEHLFDQFRLWIGIEHQVGLGLGVILAKGVVQQVVEDLAVERGLLPIIGQKCLQRRLVGQILIPILERQFPQLCRFGWHHVRLQVEEDLQAVFDLAEEVVVFAQQHPLLVSQAAALFQVGHGLERIAGAKLRQVTAVEQLQKLDHELDVADAAVANFYVAGPVFAVGRLLDPPLERLDAADVCPAEISR